ncbi:MAG: ribosomal RNA small subunit methyltransferase A [Desulfobacterales bacterium]|nr:MAG: ribosomal RNA small subunit methyltransferase A [Desulfobacterales bacterium]
MTHPGKLLKQNNLYAGKELGQNFLCDPKTAQMIVDRTGVGKGTRVLEVGPGLGAITKPLARAATHVTAVEKDLRIVPLLAEELKADGIENVDIVTKDILKTDIYDIASPANSQKLVVVGNLPYNISSQILFKLIKVRAVIDRAFLMFQKELAERLLSAPGGRAYSRLTAVVKYAARVSHVANVAPSNFFPRPEVDSTVLRFDFFESTVLSQTDEHLLFAVIKAAFSKRRKTLKNAMSGGELGLKKPEAGAALEGAGIDPVRRAETLTIDEFIALTQSVRTFISGQ